MVHCPIFLKRQSGITLTELLIVLAFIAFMAVAILVALNPAVQLGKARDARRKSDLNKLKNVLEDYYNDEECYPASLNCGDSLEPYLAKIPCDPKTKSSYYYEWDPNCRWYRIYADFEYEKDPEIAEVGCQDGCGPGCSYNYGVCSSNVGLEGCGEAECGTWWVCQGEACNNTNSSVKPDYCKPGSQPYCDDSTCGGVACKDQIPCTD